ncbi:9409_t:CDS:2, partial [Funneliformis mosseae]
ILFENAEFVDKDLIIPFDEILAIDILQTTLSQMIKFVKAYNIKEIWTFIDNENNDKYSDLEDEFQEDDNISDKKNEPLVLLLQNLE